MKKITRAEIKKILDTYSIRKDEFVPTQIDCCYQSSLIKGYLITISRDRETGRIIVSHSQDDGRRTYTDIWEYCSTGGLQFRFRNLWNQPSSDADYIKDLEEQVVELKQAGRMLQAQLQENQKLISDTARRVQPEHNARGAGRKPSKERLAAIEQVRAYIADGYSDRDIMDALGISRATFYRYKKSIDN